MSAHDDYLDPQPWIDMQEDAAFAKAMKEAIDSCLARVGRDDCPSLIAAAPDMLAALERLARLGNGERYGNSDGNMIARAAIAKARGEA